jgi:hypothetical protein
VKSEQRVEAEKISQHKVYYLLNITPDEQQLSEWRQKYGLGSTRTLHDYEEFSGVHFQQQVIDPKAAWGLHSKDDFQPELTDLLTSLQSTNTPSSNLVLQLLSMASSQ